MASNAGPKNVIIFGESGAGKSSLVNLITESSRAHVSNRAIGCTFQSQSYECGGFTYYDTVGLSEGTEGQTTAQQAIRNLISLMKNLSGGVSVLIYVIPQGRIKETTEKNYNLFVNGICDGKVPVILVVTKCELDDSMTSWWEQNKCHFDDYDMQFVDVVCGTAADADTVVSVVRQLVAERREDTRHRLQQSIERHCLQEPWKMKTWVSWLKLVLNNVWKAITGLPCFSFMPNLRDIFMSDGQMSPHEATELSNSIAAEAMRE